MTKPGPYSDLPLTSFWRRAISRQPWEDIDPVEDPRVKITKHDRVATVGSCFAQHISRFLIQSEFNYLVTEPGPCSMYASDEGYGIFPARFGNIYSVRQFVQLFLRAYGIFEPIDSAWPRDDGTYVDPFRPYVQAQGFPNEQAVERDRSEHFRCVRNMFEQCDFLIFTLGLTEAWTRIEDGAVFPFAPAVVGGPQSATSYQFINFTPGQMMEDLTKFIRNLQFVNPRARIILTVSPVPLIATFEKRHVLVSNSYSKSALRVVAEDAVSRWDHVSYFPSYEIITGTHTQGRYFSNDFREVTESGVERVMSLFRRHYLDQYGFSRRVPLPRLQDSFGGVDQVEFQAVQEIICDEEVLDQGLQA